MSLIELLGGYGEARKFAAVLSEKLTEKQKNNVVFMDAFNELNNELLEYRRQHNIFEVGDKVVCKYKHTHLFGDVVLEIAYFRDDLKGLGDFVRFTNGNDFNMDALRHATDEEIEVGYRHDLDIKPFYKGFFIT